MRYRITIRQMDGEDIYKGMDVYEQIIDDLDLHALVRSVNTLKTV